MSIRKRLTQEESRTVALEAARALLIELGPQAVTLKAVAAAGFDAVDPDLAQSSAAREFGLAASRGSDFHSPDESHTDLGTLPYLPGHLTPVWDLLASRIQ